MGGGKDNNNEQDKGLLSNVLGGFHQQGHTSGGYPPQQGYGALCNKGTRLVDTLCNKGTHQVATHRNKVTCLRVTPHKVTHQLDTLPMVVLLLVDTLQLLILEARINIMPVIQDQATWRRC